MDAPEVERALREFFTSRSEGVEAVYLFGSRGRGTAGPASDVDVAVLFSQAPAARLDSPALILEDELERVLGHAVDLVNLNSASPDLAHRVLRDGKVLFEGNPSARIAFEVRTRNEYFDLLPILRRYRKLGRGAS